MVQLTNAPEAHVDKMLDGLVAAHPTLKRAGAGRHGDKSRGLDEPGMPAVAILCDGL